MRQNVEKKTKDKTPINISYDVFFKAETYQIRRSKIDHCNRNRLRVLVKDYAIFKNTEYVILLIYKFYLYILFLKLYNEFKTFTGTKLELPPIEKFNAIERKSGPSLNRVDFYQKLIKDLGQSNGFLVSQKNTAIEDEVVIVLDKKFTVVAANQPFYSTESLDSAILWAFGLITIFKLKWPQNCERLASFFNAIGEAKFSAARDDKVDEVLNYFF